MPEVDTFKSNALVVRKGTTSGGKCSSTKGTEPEVDTFKSNAQEEEKIDIFPKEVENQGDSGTEGERTTVDTFLQSNAQTTKKSSISMITKLGMWPSSKRQKSDCTQTHTKRPNV